MLPKSETLNHSFIWVQSFWTLNDFLLIDLNTIKGGLDHFMVYTPEANIILYVNYISKKEAVVTKS